MLNNAVKFSAKQSTVVLDLFETETEITLCVTDKGKGIAPADLPKIFEEYYRGENHKHEGMGLGLFLTKTIIEQHHGRISAQSKVNVGTTITVNLPKAQV